MRKELVDAFSAFTDNLKPRTQISAIVAARDDRSLSSRTMGILNQAASLSPNRLLSAQSISYLGHGAFWAAVFLLNVGPHWEKYKTTRELIETAGMITGLQFLTAVIALKILVPKYLERNQIWIFVAALLAVVFAVSQLNILARVLYLEPLYPDSYAGFLKNFGHMSLLERLDPTWTGRYILFSKVPLFIFPTALLIAFQFHKKQQQNLRWREQKQSAELNALRNQLNPHFIFNTLNNIYALALKKSDQAPLAIEKLSNILDYVVYRCNDQYVSLKDEIILAENYLALEKLRYGDRLSIELEVEAIDQSIKIAPLLLLTLLENACKHSARNELNQATVNIRVHTSDTQILVRICNSKPSVPVPTTNKPRKVGLENLSKQLELLYPDEHVLEVENTQSHYTAKLSVVRR